MKVNLDVATAVRYVEAVRGESPGRPMNPWPFYRKSQFGEDLVGGWLMENEAFADGLSSRKCIDIPKGGLAARRRVDWLVGDRKIVEVKTYDSMLTQGPGASNTHQIADFAVWRDKDPSFRSVVLARVAWNGHFKIHPTLQG